MSHSVRRGPEPEDPRFERVTLVSDDGVEAAFVPGAGLVGVSLTLDGVELLGEHEVQRVRPEGVGLAELLFTLALHGWGRDLRDRGLVEQ